MVPSCVSAWQRFWRIRLPLAPLPEQHRIVAKLDELFSELDAGVAALERAQTKLKRYRASVLKAAVEGKLTEEWRRDQSAPDETGEELLQRILVERRKRWEQEQLAKFKAQGRKPPKNWKAEVPGAGARRTRAGCRKLPEGWCWATVDQVSEVISVAANQERRQGVARPVNVTPTGEVCAWYKVGDMNLPGNESWPM